MKKKTIFLVSLAAVMLVYYWCRIYAQYHLPLQITRDRMESLLKEGDIRDATLLYNKNKLLITLTDEAIKAPENQKTLKDRHFPFDRIGPHYYLKVPDAFFFADQFTTMVRTSPRSRKTNYDVVKHSSLKYPVLITEVKLPSLLFSFSDIFLIGFYLGKIAFYVGIFYALILLIRRLSKPEPFIVNLGRGKGKTLLPNQDTSNFPIKLANKTIFKPTEEIACFYAQDNHVYLYNKEGKEHLVEYTLADLEAKLPQQFVRVHRSSIINSHLIQEVKKQPGSRFAIRLRDAQQKEIITGQSYAAPVKQLLEI